MSQARSTKWCVFLFAATLLSGYNASAGDELYRFSGKNQDQSQTALTQPQEQLRQEDVRPRQQAGQAATSILNDKSGPPGSNQVPEGTPTTLPGGGPKMGVGPVGPGGVSRATSDPNEGPNRYANRPPSWENLNETDAGRNRNAPGEGNTSVASGANIFGTSPVPFSVGPETY